MSVCKYRLPAPEGPTLPIEPVPPEVIPPAPEPAPQMAWPNFSFPRSENPDGYLVEEKEIEVVFTGPFADFVAIRVYNESQNSPVFVYCREKTSRATATRIAPGESRRPQFPCPGANNKKLEKLTIVVFAKTADANARFFVELDG